MISLQMNGPRGNAASVAGTIVRATIPEGHSGHHDALTAHLRSARYIANVIGRRKSGLR